jgi:hypothetical protein
VPLLLRKINKARWNHEEKPDWLPNGQIPAQTLCDLKAKENSLSVWFVEEDHSNLDDVIVALCSACDQPDKMDYALFDEKDCHALGICIDDKPEGNTPDNRSRKWHRNLIRLSVSKVSKLADMMYKKAIRDRVTEARVKKMIRSAWSEGRIDEDRLRKKMKVFLGLEKVKKCPECGQEVE